MILKKGVKSMFNVPCIVETFYKKNMNTIEFNNFLKREQRDSRYDMIFVNICVCKITQFA